jgi:hypothetical protein
MQFAALGGSTEADRVCPNEKNRNAYAQGVGGPPAWIEKTCAFRWITLDLQHEVTSGCPDGHISRGFLAVVATFADGALTFGGVWVPGTGLP